MITTIYIDDVPLEEHIQKEVERRIAEYPVHVTIAGEDVDIDSFDTTGGEINISINNPLYFHQSDIFVTINKNKIPLRMCD